MELGQKITFMDLPVMRSFHHCVGAGAKLQRIYQEINCTEAAMIEYFSRSLEGKGRRENIWNQVGKGERGVRQDKLVELFLSRGEPQYGEE